MSASVTTVGVRRFPAISRAHWACTRCSTVAPVEDSWFLDLASGSGYRFSIVVCAGCADQAPRSAASG